MKRIVLTISCLFISVALHAECQESELEISNIISDSRFLQKDVVVGLRCLLNMPSAEITLVSLSNSESKTARLYALIGLRHLKSKNYALALEQVVDDHTKFEYVGSDYYRETTISEVAKDIDQGLYDFHE